MSQEQTREEFLAKKNRFGIPGYTDQEVDEHMEAFEFKGNPAVKCACCGNLMLAEGICLLCGMDEWQGTTRGQRIHYRKLIKAHPEYIWEVNFNESYSEEEVTFSEEELISIEEEKMDIKSILQQVFGAVPDSFDDEKLKELQDEIDDEDFWHQKEYLYRKDIVNLLERVKEFADGDMSIVWDALVNRISHVKFFQNHKNVSKEEYLEYLTELRDHLRKEVLKRLDKLRQKKHIEFNYSFDSLWADRSFVLEAVKVSGFCIQFAEKEIKNDHEFAMQALRNGDVLQYLSEVLRSDYEIVMESVGRYGKSLEFASEELKSNPEIVYVAMRQNPDAFAFASPEAKKEMHKRFRRKRRKKS